MSSNTRVDAIRSALESELNPTSLEVIDDSAAHIGHPGAAAGGGHYTVIISADCFDGLSRINSHKLVYKALGDMMQHEIHALNIKINQA